MTDYRNSFEHDYRVEDAGMWRHGWQWVTVRDGSLSFFIPPVEHFLTRGDALTVWSTSASDYTGENLAVSINGAPALLYT